MIFDTHVHYNLDPIYPEWQNYWKKAQEAGVNGGIIPGADLESSKKSVEISRENPVLFSAVGVHPHEAIDLDLENIERELEKLLSSSQKIVAIGECGLDYFRIPETELAKTKIAQKKLFGLQIQLAKKLNLPLIIHARDAYEDILDTIKHFSSIDGIIPKAILHCVSGPLSYIQKAIECGWYMGFAGNVTYPNAQNIREILHAIPEDRILIETDVPYLPPQQFRGQTNEPAFVIKTAEFIHKERFSHLSFEEFSEKIWKNTKTCFSRLE